MATTLTEPSSTDVEALSFSFPISKTERDADGDLVVYGVATDGTVDSDRQIVDPEWSGKALADWLSTGGNVRMSHDPQRPVGKGLSVELDRDGNGQHWVKSVVVDPVAQRLVEKGILRAYSVGISQPVIKRDPSGRAPGGIICGGELSELSIVDRPANKNSYLELATKAAGSNKAQLTGVFHEGVSDDTVKKAAGTFSPADLAKLLAHRQAAEKRNMDPDVGGGVDRDKLPASDFAGRDRSFPIVTPGDVSDAASSIGRAGSSNYSSEKLKRNIIRIARRKGPSFVAELPESWTSEKGSKVDKYAMQANPPQSPPTPGAMPPAGAPHPAAPVGHAPAPAAPAPGQMPQHAAPAPGPAHPAPGSGQGDMSQPQAHQAPPQPGQEPAAIGKCNCPCGYEMDDHMNFCPGCGSPVDKGDQNNGGPNVASDGMLHVEVPMQQHAGAQHDGQDATKADVPSGATTSVGEPKESDPVDSVTEAKKPKKKQPKPKSLDPATGVYEKKPKKNGKIPVPAEAQSVDGLPSTQTSKSFDHATQTAMLLKGMNVPADLGALHDLLCPGFHPDDAEKCHPSHSLKSMDTVYWQTEALNAAAGAPLDEAVAASNRWQAAEAVKSRAIDNPTEVLEIRHEAHKAFKDAQIGPGTAPVPTQIRAGQFKRPLITAGHGRPSSGQESPNTADVPDGGIAASQFSGGYLSSGHADESPSNSSKANDSIAYPKATGRIETIDFSGASRDAAKSAMNAIHDHISHTFPDLCPMGSPGGTESLGHVPAGDTTVPQPVGNRASKSEEPEVAKAAAPVEAAPVDIAALLQGMKDEFSAELKTLTKSLKAERKRNEQLQATVDSMAALPDPNVAAFKGVALTHPIHKGASPTARSVAETAEQTQLMMMRELETQFRNSPDPAQREAAWSSLMKMRGL